MSILAYAGTAVPTLAFVLLAAAAARAQATSPKRASSVKSPSLPPPSLWHLGVNADVAWYENAQFVGGPDAASTWRTGGTAGLSYSHRLSTGTFGIGGFGGALYYPDLKDLNQPTWGGDFNLNVAPSPRTQLRLGQTYTHTNTRQFEFDPAALPLPTSALEYATSTAGLTHNLSRSWQLGLDGSFDLRQYADSRLVDGKQALAQVQLGRQVGKSSALYMGYGFMNAWYASTTNRAHQALLGVRRQPKRGVGLEVAGGVAYLETVGQLYPAGNASLRAHGQHTTLALTYKRDFGQAYGYGRQMVGDLGAASLGWTPATRLNLTASYSYGYRRDAADLEYKIRSQVASGGIGWGTTKGLALSARYSWEMNETEGLARIEGGRATASISYGVEWR